MRRVLLAASIAAALVMLFSLGARADVLFEPPRGAVGELKEKWTPTSRTWSLPDGQRVTQFSAEPEQWKDGAGVWRELRPDLQLRGDRWEAQTADVGVSMPSRLGDRSASAIRVVGSRGDEVALLVAGAVGSAVATGSRLTFKDARPGADVALDVVPGGVKETVTLGGRGSSRSLVYRLQTGAEDLVVEEDGQGGAVVRRGDARVFAISKPAVIDAGGDVSVRARLSVERRGEREWELRTVLDDAWLDAPERRWPVIVDPTIVEVNTFRSSAADDCQSYYGNDAAPPLWKPSAFPEWHACNQLDWRSVGHHADGPWWYAGYQLLRFNTLTSIQGDQIASARLSLYRGSSTTPNRSDVGIYPLTADTGTIVTAPTPGRHRYVVGRFDERLRVGLIPSGPVAMVDADVTGVVTQWRRYSESSGRSGLANRGLLLRHEDVVHRVGDDNSPTEHGASWCRVQACDQTYFASSTHPTATQRPMLEVKSWPAAPAGTRVISPTEGELSGRWIKLQARATNASVTTARFQYIAGGGSVWRDIPLSALRGMDREVLRGQDVPVEGGSGDRRSRLVVWDVAGTPGGDVDGPVRVRAFLESPTLGHGGMTEEVEARLDRRGVSRSAVVELEPGRLDLTTGEFSMSATDATFKGYLQDLNLTRTYTSRGVAKRNADMFGPGWEGNVEADGGELPYKGIYNFSKIEEEVIERQEIHPRAFDWEGFWDSFMGCLEDDACIWEDPDGPGYEVETVKTIDRWEYRYAVVELNDGTKTTFRQVVNPNGEVTGWEPEDGLPGYRLRHDPTGTPGVFEFTLTETSGGVAKFTSEIANSPNYRLRSYQQAGNPTALSYTYEASGARQRLKRVTAPYPAGGTPRWMEFDWSYVSTPEAGCCERVTGVRVGTGAGAGTAVASYGYYPNGRLMWVTDPRVSPAIYSSYAYDTRGMLETIADADQVWGLRFTRVSGDDGPRLASISRPHPDGGTAVRTVRYDVPLGGTGAPHDMSIRETARWDQVDDDVPWSATAIFPADDIPAAENPNYSRATIYYTDTGARLVNVAEPGGHISTTGYDDNNNPVRELSAANRARALAAGASSAVVAQDLSSVMQYSRDGIDLFATFEPRSDIKLTDGRTVTGRRLTSTHYDENAPGGGPFHLPTSQWRAVELGGGTRADEHEVIRYSYAGNGGMSGWTARQWTEKVLDPAGKRLTTRRFLLPTLPLVEESRTPAGAAGGARPDVRFYQYEGIAPVRVPAAVRGCYGAFSIPSGFRCLDTDAMPEGRQDRRYIGYDAHGRQRETYEYADGWSDLRRLSVKDYHPDDQVLGAWTWELVGTGDLTFTAYSRDTATGRINRVDAVRAVPGGTSTIESTILREYDANGRLKTYTDASGTVTRYRYDLRGRPVETVENGTRTTTYGYDNRDNLISVNDPSVDGAITATYDPSGDLLTETFPQGLELTQTNDEVGNPRSLRWTKTWGCSSNCVVASSDVVARDVAGGITGMQSDGLTQTSNYDTVGRLIATDERDTVADVCTRTTYEYDGGGGGASNRTRAMTAVGAARAACGTGTPRSRTWTYDSGDRVTNPGWTFDAHGRATAVPAPDSGGVGPLTATFSADDRVRQLSLDGRTHTYSRDPLRRTKTMTSSGGGRPNWTRNYRYADDSDEPISSGSDRNISGPSGMLVAVKPGASNLVYQLRDIQGSIIETIPVTPSGTLLTSNGSIRYDAFGKILRASPSVVNWTNGIAGYGWLGGHQRNTQFEQAAGSGPPIEMGYRVYLPSVGRFMQRDPVEGGSANDYDYALQDPLNVQDLDGRCVFGAPCPDIAKKAIRKVGGAVKTITKPGRKAFDIGKNLIKGAARKTPIGWGACFGWKMSQATRGRTPSAKEVAKISVQCTGGGFVLE